MSTMPPRICSASTAEGFWFQKSLRKRWDVRQRLVRSSGKFRSQRPCIRSKSPHSSTVRPNRRPCPAKGQHSECSGRFVPGPDIVGDMSGLQQFGSASGQVGLATGATSCNNGDVPCIFINCQTPDHSVVSQNLYRMSGGSSNNDRFEQLGQAWVKHTFGASQENACGFGCTPFPDQSELGVGCSDPYHDQNGFQGAIRNA